MIIPVYNEQSTVAEVIQRVRALPLPLEIIVVDDGSTDGTGGQLEVVSQQWAVDGSDTAGRPAVAPEGLGAGDGSDTAGRPAVPPGGERVAPEGVGAGDGSDTAGRPAVAPGGERVAPEGVGAGGVGAVLRVYTSPTNFGKGAAIRIGLSFVNGEVVIIQDADLELDPEEYPRLLAPLLDGRTSVVYGSRFLRPAPGVPRRTRLANRLLAAWCNLLYLSRLTDVSTAYKVFRTPLLRELQLRSIGFEFCAEVTGKLLRRGERIVEVPVGYHPRTEAAGKKLNYARDGLKAAWVLLCLRCSRGRAG